MRSESLELSARGKIGTTKTGRKKDGPTGQRTAGARATGMGGRTTITMIITGAVMVIAM